MTGKPIIAKLTRCIDGKTGRNLLGQHKHARHQITAARSGQVAPEATATLVEAQRRGLAQDR